MSKARAARAATGFVGPRAGSRPRCKQPGTGPNEIAWLRPLVAPAELFTPLYSSTSLNRPNDQNPQLRQLMSAGPQRATRQSPHSSRSLFLAAIRSAVAENLP